MAYASGENGAQAMNESDDRCNSRSMTTVPMTLTVNRTVFKLEDIRHLLPVPMERQEPGMSSESEHLLVASEKFVAARDVALRAMYDQVVGSQRIGTSF